MRILLIILAVLVALVAAVVLIGWALPERHEVSRSADLPQPPDVVWRVLTDAAAFPSWRRDVASVEQLSASPGHESWREKQNSGGLTYEVAESEPPRRLVTRIADKNLPFGGSWTYELSPVNGGTRLTITERGEVYNPVFRFVSRFVIGHTATMDHYLEDLRKKLGG